MEFLSNKPLLITDTILRDAHQSQAATRMTLEQMLPACEILDSIGYYSLECWGGATFDACLRFLDEDPWERLRQLRAHLPHTKLQMLFRGQNILGYKHYADDVVDEFCGKSIDNGIDIIRIFDALNDVRNLEQAIKSTKKYGGQVEATLSYTISPIHNEDYFVKLAKELEQMGADALCIKDMANLLLPMDAYSLVKRLKETVSIPIHLHTHNTTDNQIATYLMAAEAGVDVVDTAIGPLANLTSQPSMNAVVESLRGQERDTGFDPQRLQELADYWADVRLRYAQQQAKFRRLPLSREQLLLIAQHCPDVRRLSGVILRVASHRSLLGRDLSEQDLLNIVRQGGDSSALTPQLIVSIVGEHCGVPAKEILGEKRRPDLVQARQLAMYLCRELLGHSYPVIGRMFGGKDHSTVMHGVKKIKLLQESDRLAHSMVTELTKACLEHRG